MVWGNFSLAFDRLARGSCTCLSEIIATSRLICQMCSLGCHNPEVRAEGPRLHPRLGSGGPVWMGLLAVAE